MDCKVFCVVLIGCFAAQLANAGPAVDDIKGHSNMIQSDKPTIEESLFKKLNTKCTNHDISSCMMLKLVTYFNRLMKKSNIEFGDVEITQTSTETVSVESSRSINDIEKMSEEEQLYEVLADKTYDFMRTRSLKWKIVDGADIMLSSTPDADGGLKLGLSLRPTKEGNGVEESRKKKGGKGGGGMGALLAAVAMKIGLLKALAFKALVLLVGKALLVSKLALVLAAIIGLKKLLSSEKHVTYEVVAHPHHEHEHHDIHHSAGGYDGGHGGGAGWGRNFDTKEAQNMAYSAHIPAN